MPSLIGLVVLAAVLCGGAWGWRVGTKRLYRRSIFRDDDDDRGARGWRRRVRQSLFDDRTICAVEPRSLVLCPDDDVKR